MKPKCVHCGQRATRVCGACSFAPYCGEQCAGIDWPVHCEAEPHVYASVQSLNLVWEPNLWLGGIAALNELDEHRIYAVLTVIQRNERNDPSWLAQKLGPKRNTVERWLWLSHHDTPDEDMSVDFERAVNFIHGHLSKGRSILIHCHAGASRSATMICAYLLRFHGDQFPSVDSAIDWLQARRPIVDPNIGFRAQLEEWRIRWI
jgi:protein-tyrosine phosphatase